MDEAFFERGDPASYDGRATNRGALWHAQSSRWGHSMHSMCSYHGMFPARLAHYFIERFTEPGGLVADPFSGRGTTALQARIDKRIGISGDLNPLAFVLSAAKARPPSWDEVNSSLDALAVGYQPDRVQVDASDDIAMLYSEETLRQVLYLRSHLHEQPMSRWSAVRFMIAGCLAGILHGSSRADGRSSYLSIDMPNTFSMSPQYVQRYIEEYNLTPPDQDVFERLREKIARVYLDAIGGIDGRAQLRDASAQMTDRRILGRVDLLLTSPPYLQVVNYGQSNWIRLWLLGLDDLSRSGMSGRRRLDERLDHGHGYLTYRAFMTKTFNAIGHCLAPDGVAVVVIGDVAVPGEAHIELAEQLWRDVHSDTPLQLEDVIVDEVSSDKKVSRIWGETRGRATETDRALILVRRGCKTHVDNSDICWEEPWKDAGPDDAHARLERLRRCR
jgi:site-specific DNA-methyltransferase (adenine-specific)